MGKLSEQHKGVIVGVCNDVMRALSQNGSIVVQDDGTAILTPKGRSGLSALIMEWVESTSPPLRQEAE